MTPDEVRELAAEAKQIGSNWEGWDCDGSASICDRRVELIDRAADALAVLSAPQEAKWEHGVICGEDLLHRLMDTLAYYHCRSVNPKADSPHMGYHAMSEDQREFLRERQREAAEEVVRMWAAATQPPAPQEGDAREPALNDATEKLDEVILAHVLKADLPIPSYDKRRRALCTCGESLIYEGEYIALSWHRDHLADAILAALPVLSRAAAPEPDIEALRAARAETWDEAIAAVFAWWAAAPEDRPAVVVNPYGVGLPGGGDDGR